MFVILGLVIVPVLVVLILAVLLWATGTPPRWTMLAFPLFVVDLVLMTVGIALLLAPLHVRFHDIGYLWGIAVQVGFWLTPIIYQETMIPRRWQWLITYNPLARIILYSRQVVIYGIWPDWVGVTKTSVAAVMAVVLGWASFQRLQPRLVEHF